MNLFDIPARRPAEHIDELLTSPDVRIERIVSQGHASPPDVWYDQDRPEWVIVIKGSAELLIEGDAAPRKLNAGDHVNIPAHVRHRVAWTDEREPTVWLAVHY
jgi:cupin 2 domain-containing protein